MTYAEMSFMSLCLDDRGEYSIIFKDHAPEGYGCEADPARLMGVYEVERAESSARDSLYDCGGTIARSAADGQLYKVAECRGVRVWARCERRDHPAESPPTG